MVLFVARSGRPGSVLIDHVSDDVVDKQSLVDTPVWDNKEELLICPPPLLRPPELTSAQLEKLIGLLRESKRPLLYVGSGCFEWRNELTRFVEPTGIPVFKAAARSDTPVYLTDGDFILQSYREPYNRFSVENFDLLLALDVESYYDGILDLRRSDSVILEFHNREEEEEVNDEMTFLDRHVQPGSVSSVRCGDTKSLLDRLNHLIEEGNVGSGLDFSTWRNEIDDDRSWKRKRPIATWVPFSFYFKDVVNEVANRGDTFLFTDREGYRVRFLDWFTRGITSPWDIFEIRIDNCMIMRLSIAAGAAIGKGGGRRSTRTRSNGGGSAEEDQEEEFNRNNIIHVLHDLHDFTIEELEVLKRENLPLKVVILNNAFSYRSEPRSTTTHLMGLVEALEIPCRRIAKKSEVRDALIVMMETPEPCVLDIILVEDPIDEKVEWKLREIHKQLSFYSFATYIILIPLKNNNRYSIGDPWNK